MTFLIGTPHIDRVPSTLARRIVSALKLSVLGAALALGVGRVALGQSQLQAQVQAAGPIPGRVAAGVSAEAAGKVPATALAGKSTEPAELRGGAPAAVRERVQMAAMPLAFEPNRGQSSTSARFVARGLGYALRLEDGRAVMRFGGAKAPAKPDADIDRGAGAGPAAAARLQTTERPADLSMDLVGANRHASIAGESQLQAMASYFGGHGLSGEGQSLVGLPTYARVRYQSVYPGVDLSFYGKGERLEYDFLVRAGADAQRLKLKLRGAESARVDDAGNLVLRVGGRQVRFLKPVAYLAAKAGEPQQSIPVGYVLAAGGKNHPGRLSFAVGAYDHTRDLVIDPVLDYGTFLSSSDSTVTGIAVDKAGNTYLATGQTGYWSGGYYNFGFMVLKFDPNGNLLSSSVVTATGNGSSAGIVYPTGIAVSDTGSVYVTGYSSGGLPTTANAYQAANPNVSASSSYYLNAFLAVLTPNGSTTAPSLVPSYISYLGGTGSNGNGDAAYAVAVDASGNAYIAGTTGGEPFPTTTGAYQTAYPSGATSAGFIAKFNPSKSGASSLVYSTLLGGTRDSLYGIAVDASGNAYVTGSESSGAIPVSTGAYSYNGYVGGPWVDVVKLNPAGSALVYSAILGPGYAPAIAVDGSGDAYVAGTTTAEDYPTTTGAYQTSYPGPFATELNPAGAALVYSTFLGGPGNATNYNLSNPLSIALPPGCASACNAYIAGITTATDFPTVNAIQSYQSANSTGFVVELAGSGASAVYSTYLGGMTSSTNQPGYAYFGGPVNMPVPALGVDSSGNAYVTGNGPSDFPVTPLPVEPSGSLESSYLAKIGPAAAGDVVASPTYVNFYNDMGPGIINVSSAIYPGRTAPTVTLLNTGSTAVTLTSILTSPANEFAQTNNCAGAISPGSSCTVTLTFTPESAGNRFGTLTVATSASSTPVTVALTGYGQDTPYLQFTPGSLTFPDQATGATGTAQTVTLTNIGHTPATNLNVYTNNAVFPFLSNCPSQLDPSQSCQVSVQFAPNALGAAVSSISVNTNSNQLNVSGTGIATGSGGSGTSALWPGALNMGSTPVGVDVNMPFYFANTGASVPVTIYSVSVALTSSIGNVNDFGVGSCFNSLPYQIAAGYNCIFTAYFTPSVVGTETATITVTDSSASSPHTVTVSGIGLGLTQTLEFSPANQVFLDQPLGYQSASQEFRVTNSGTAPVTIDRTLITGDFQITDDGCSGRTLPGTSTPGVNGGGYCYVDVAFTPTALGASTGTLSLIDAATGTPQMLNLSGNGIAVTGSLMPDPNSLNFTTQPVGTTSAQQNVYLNNPGNTTVTVNSFTTTGDFAVVDNNCAAPPFPITPNGQCSVAVTFTPSGSTANPRTGTLTIGSSAGNQTVSLTGTGEVATQSIAFTPASTLNFGSVTSGASSYGSSPVGVFVRNTGTEAVTFNAAATITGNYSIYSDQCTNGGGGTLAANSSCVILLTFTPNGTGTQNGTLTLNDSAGKQTLSVTGIGIASSVTVAMNAELADFSQQPAGSNSAGSYTSYAYLYNYGSQVVNIASVSITSGGGSFSITGGYNSCTGGSVQPGSYCQVQVQFNPTAVGYDTGTLTYVDTQGNKYAGALAGYSPADVNSATLSPVSNQFPSQVVGTTSGYPPQLTYLYNTGNLPFTVGSVTGTNYSATGTAPAEFSLETNAYGDQCSNNSVQPGQGCYVGVLFTPSAAGSRTGSLVFPVTYAGATSAVNLTASLSGVGIADKKEAILSPTAVTFTDQVVGTSGGYNGTQLIRLYNTGNLPLTVGALSGTNYSASGPSSSTAFSVNPNYYGDQCSNSPVQPGQSCYVGVEFTPGTAGAQTGTIVFPVTYSGATKAVNFTATLNGKGIADANSANLSPSSVAFAGQVVGTSSGTGQGQVIYLYNTGNLPFTVGTLSGTNYSASGPSSTTAFSVNPNNYGDQCSNMPVQPGQSCYVGVEFTPLTTGNLTGTVVFPVTNAGATKPVNFTATLSGLGVAVANSASVSTANAYFPPQIVGTTSSGPYYVLLYNTGNFPFTIGTVTGTNYSATGPSSNAEFYANTNYGNNGDSCSGQPVSPGSSCILYLQFTPNAAGNQTSTLVFPVTYAGATKPVNFTANLSGVGISTTATLVLSQTGVAFGNQPVGTASGQIGVTLTNYSSSSLPITNIILGGANPTDFSENDNCGGSGGTTLGAGQSCTIYATFNPGLKSLGSRKATVTETDPGTGGLRTITLTGNGTADVSAVTFYPASLAFATAETVNEGTPGKVVTLSYAGSLALNVTSVTSTDPTEFPVVQDGCSGQTVASGSSCQVIIGFSPTKTGALSAMISVADSAGGSPQTFVVTGGGAAQASSTTTLVASPPSAAFGTLFTLTATVSSGTTPVANGSVTFYDGAKAIGTAQVVTTTAAGGVVGTETLKTLYLPLGANSITAKYTGGNAASTAAAATVTVTGKYPDTAVLSSTGVQGSYVLTGTVASGGPATPPTTGKIVFTDKQTSTTLGTVSLDPTTLMQSFVTASTPAVGGNYPTNVTLADVNGDGKADLLVGGNFNGFVLALGNGDGTFQPAQTVAGYGGNALIIVVADVNGDGKPDVIVADSNVGVFLGNGDGTFQGEVDYDNGVQSIAAGDLNGDGKPDIVTITNSNSVDVLLGNGDGTFQDPVSVGSGSYFLALADFNGDGKLDIIVTDLPSNNQALAVLLGNGNGTFQSAKVTQTTYYDPGNLCIADLNGDGKLDLVVNNAGNYLGVMLGKGDGTFQSESLIESGSFNQPAVADINGDGKPDLIVPNAGGANNTISVFPGNGDGTFGDAVSYPTGKYPNWVSVADINNDGKPDLAVVNYQDDTTSILLNQVTQSAKLTGVTLPGVSADPVVGVYSGDANDSAATTNTLTLASNAGVGSTTLSVTPTSGALGTEFTLSATAVNAAGAKVTAGSVNFFANGVLLANIAIDSNTGVATYSTRSLPIGTVSLGATFTGTDSNKASSSKNVTVTVSGKYPTTTALTAAGVQGSYAFSATVDAFGLGHPSGSVVFTDASVSPAATLGTVALSSAAEVSTFLPGATPTLTAGSNARWVVSADFNGDGKQDLAVANYGSNNVSIFLGNGDGTFAAQLTTSVLSNPTTLAVGDFNGDGKPDLAVADLNSPNSVTILLGNGDGTFTTGPNLTAGSNPYSVAVADVNGDGRLDLVVGNYNGTMVSVSLGNGDGTFRAANSFGSSFNGIYSLTVGDFNHDGNPDIATANGSSVGIFLGNGDGTFGTETDYTASGGTTQSIATADLNLDGKLDLVTANTQGSVSVLFGNGDGTFQAAQVETVASGAFTAVVADVNGDGNPDLVVAGYSGSNTVSVLLGNGAAGTFQPAQNYTVGSFPSGVAVGDWNGDGRPDIAAANYNSGNVSILLGAVTQGVSITGISLPGLGSDNVTASYVGDTVFAGSTSNTLNLPSKPIGTTTTLSATPTSAALGATVTLKATVADTNSHAVTSGSVSFYNGTTLLATVQVVSVTSSTATAGNATYSTRALPPGTDSLTAKFTGTATDAASTSSAQTVTVAGKYPTTTTLTSTGTKGNYTLTTTVNAYASRTPSGNVNFIDTTVSPNVTLGTAPLSAATAGFNFVPGATPGTGTNPYFITMADVNNDQKLDLVVGNYDGTMVSVLLGNGDGTYQTAISFGTNVNGIYALAVGDFNSDGKLDVATANGSSIGVFLGNGDGTFGAETDYAAPGTTYSVAVGDFNHDGKLDVVAASSGGTLSVFLGNGDGTLQTLQTLQTQQPYAGGTGYVAVAVGDFNGDGKLDLAEAEYSQGVVGIFLGNGDGTFQTSQTFAAGSGPIAIALADINADGKLDAVVGNNNSANLTVLLGNGDGTLKPGTTVASGGEPASVEIGDINGDGKLDLVVGNYQSSTIGLYLGNGDGTFQTPTAISAATPNSVALGDVNNDGRPDIASADYTSGNTAAVFLNQLGLTATLTGVNVPGSGTHNIIATYAGDTNFTPSTSPTIELAATLATSSITLAAQPSATVAYASPLSVLVTVTGQVGTNTPTGNVTYTVDGGPTQTAALANGIVTLNLSGLAVGSHTLVVNYAGDQIHAAATQQSIALIVTKAAQTISFAEPGNQTYGNGGFYVYPSASSGLPVTVTVVSGPATVSSSNLVTITGAGTVVLQAAQGGNASYNAATPVQQTFTVAKAALSVVVNNQTKIYGNANPTFTSTITGLVGSDTVTVTYSTTATTTSNYGTYPINATLSGAALANYTPTVTAGTLTITKTVLTVVINNQSRSYGAANPTLTGTISGLKGTDTASATYTTTATVTSPVVSGGYPITATVSGNNLSNYMVEVTNGTLTVNPAALTITVANATKVYGTANPSFSSTLTGVENSDSVPITYSTSAVNTTGVGSYSITAATADANYSATVMPGTLQITPAKLAIAVNGLTKVYGSVNPAFTGTVTGLLFSDTVTTTYATTAVQYSYVNTYPITASISGGSSANYTAVVTPGVLSVTQALLKIVVNNGTRVYGAANPSFTGTVTGLLDNDAVVVTCSSSSTVKTTVGSYANIGAAISGAPAVNYSPQVTDGTLTITPAPLTAAVNASNKVYGAALPAFSTSFTGLVNGDTLTASYATTATASSAAGNYTVNLSLSGALSPNYTPTITAGTLTVTPATLTVTATNASAVYGSAIPALTDTITGLVNGDTASVITGAAAESTTAAKGSGASNYTITITQGTLAAKNYTFTFVNGLLTITPAPLTLTVANQTRLYGAANPTLSGTLTGVVNGDTITPSYSTGATASSSVGHYSINGTLAGVNLGNYTQTIVPGSMSVTPAPLNVVVANATRVYGAANPTFTGTVTGLLNSDTVTVSYSTAATAASPVGSYAINATVAGAAAANYTATVTPGTLTVKPLQIATPSFSPAASSYTAAQSVSITDSTAGVTIYYTTNGTTPTTGSSVYSVPITVAATETLEAIAASSSSNYSASPVAIAAYTIAAGQAAAAAFTPGSGHYSGPQTVTITDTTPDVSVYYTTNGARPTSASTLYTGPITVSTSETVSAIAIEAGYTSSGISKATYNLDAATPVLTPATGTYSGPQTVTLTDATPGVSFYYTTNGTTPTTSSTLYTGPLTVSVTETVNAIAVETGYTNSTAAGATYTLAAAAPAFSPGAGHYSGPQTVTLTDITPGVSMYYTTNGTAPTTSATLYTGPITVATTETVRAIAVKAGYTGSSVVSAAYTLNAATPVFSPAAGSYNGAQMVTLTDATPGVTIYYTTNGTTPSASSTPYTGPIKLAASETIEAIAIEAGYTNSAVATASYTIH